MDDVERVFDAMWTGRAGDEVCLPIREIAAVTGLSEDVVRHAEHVLCQQRRLVFTNRRYNRTAVFQIFKTSHQGSELVGVGGETLLQSGLSDPPPDTASTAHSDTDSVAPLDDTESLVVSRVQRYIEQVGIHLDRESEVEDQVFGERGLIWKLTQPQDKRRLRASLLADEGFRARTLALWRGHRPTGEKLEREELQRAEDWKRARARLLELEAQASPRVIPAAGAAVLRDMPTPTVTELAEGLTDEARDRLEAERRNGDRPPDPDWPDLDWTPPDF